MSRRRMLRSAILFSAVGAGIILGLDSLVKAAPPSASGAGSTSKAPLLTSSSGGSSTSGNMVTVKVTYFGMSPITVNTKEEYFALQSPAYFHDLFSDVVDKHPLLSAMMPTMVILVDGVPGQPSTALKDGDEVDLIPAIAGG